eukprot:TRINITY_DN121100_c0_g1_i1.p1 TRINITY_DN121100_c0_g1~~TRINITY_DN121100_c0_g1_i1.p1  ORF type:complete len:2180 (-),score=495.11 TRINITY_DN121100_c0_g1_i1:42-6581(-)
MTLADCLARLLFCGLAVCLLPPAGSEPLQWRGPVELRKLGTWGALQDRAHVPLPGAGRGPPGSPIWVEACDGRGLCANYSKGSGSCPLAVLYDPAAFEDGFEGRFNYRLVAVHSTCRTRQAGWALHCPTEAPVAAFLIEKAGYMSALSWLAKLDAAPSQMVFAADHEAPKLLSQRWQEAAEAALLGAASYVREWLVPELQAATYSSDYTIPLGGSAARYHGHKDSTDVTPSLEPDPKRYVRAWLPPHYCPSCCAAPATGRLPLIFVRSPFDRLSSYYRMRLLPASSRQATSYDAAASQWAGFRAFVELVGRLRNETDVYDSLPTVWDHPLKKLGANKDLIFHTRAISEWLRDSGLHKEMSRLQVVRVEHLQKDMDTVGQRLCREHGYCKKLPEFPHVHRAADVDGRTSKRPPKDLWTPVLKAEVYAGYKEDFELIEHAGKSTTHSSSLKLCVIISAHYKQRTRAVRHALEDLAYLYSGEVTALVVDDASPIPISELVPQYLPGLELHVLKTDRSRYGPELGAWGFALDSGLCDGASYFAFLLSAVRFRARFDFEKALPCPLSAIWTFPLRAPRHQMDFDCCAGSGCPHKDGASGWARPELREWADEQLPAVLGREWSGAEPEAAVQGPSFLASALGVEQLRSTGIFAVRTDEEWMQQASERLLAFVFKAFGYDASQCSVEGNLYADWYAEHDGECHPDPYTNPIVQASRTKHGQFFSKTFGVVLDKKWRKVYLIRPAGAMRPLTYQDWYSSAEYAALLEDRRKATATPQRQGQSGFKFPFVAAALFASTLPVLSACMQGRCDEHRAAATQAARYALRNAGLALLGHGLMEEALRYKGLLGQLLEQPADPSKDQFGPAIAGAVASAGKGLLVRLGVDKKLVSVCLKEAEARTPSESALCPFLGKDANVEVDVKQSFGAEISETAETSSSAGLSWQVALPPSAASKVRPGKNGEKPGFPSSSSMPSLGADVSTKIGAGGACWRSSLRAVGLGFRRLEFAPSPLTLPEQSEGSSSSSGYLRTPGSQRPRCLRTAGEAVQRSGLARSDLFLTLGGSFRNRSVVRTVWKQLWHLKTSDVDLYVLHGPLHESWRETWRSATKLLRRGKVRALGLAALAPEELNRLLAAAANDPSLAMPSVLQTGTAAWRSAQTRELQRIAQGSNVAVISRSPFRPGGAMQPTQDPHIAHLAAQYRVTAEALLLRWSLHEGVGATVHVPDMATGLGSKKWLHQDTAVGLSPGQIFAFRLTQADLRVLEDLERLASDGDLAATSEQGVLSGAFAAEAFDWNPPVATPPKKAEERREPPPSRTDRQDEAEHPIVKRRGRLSQSLPRPRDEDYRGLKMFIYDLPSTFNDDLIEEMEQQAKAAGSTCDYMLSPCTEKKHTGDYSTARQWGAEVMIVRKFLAAGSQFRTSDPAMADLFVVPFLMALACRLAGHSMRCITAKQLPTLFEHLPHYGVLTRHRHLFLASADVHSLPLMIQAQPLFVSYGATSRGQEGHIVVPPSVAEAELQPGTFKDTPLDDRDILFWLAQTPNNAVRYLIQRQLITLDEQVPQKVREEKLGVNGRILIHVLGRNTGVVTRPPTPSEALEQMMKAVFCPATPAENSAAGTKRFFDVLLAGCLPMVTLFKTVWGTGAGWWRRDGSPLEWAMPFPDVINWRFLAVEAPVETLETDYKMIDVILNMPIELVEAKRKYLLSVRERLLYDLAGGKEDAFSLFMDQLRATLPRLDATFLMTPPALHVARSVGGPWPAPIVCEASPRGLDFASLPRDFGPGSGNEKGWAHTNGELSCRSAASWHAMERDMFEGAFGELEFQPTMVERFLPVSMHRAAQGTETVFYRLHTSQMAINESASGTMLANDAAAAFCTHRIWPMTCHDKLKEEDGDLVMTFCHRNEIVNLPTNTTCRLLPNFVPPTSPPPQRLLMSPKKATTWELVTWVCNLTLAGDDEARQRLDNVTAIWEESWYDKFPEDHVLKLTVYEVCSPDATLNTLGGRAAVPESMVIYEHLLNIVYAQRRGQPAPDALLLLSNMWNEELGRWQTEMGLQPRHLANIIKELMQESFSEFLEPRIPLRAQPQQPTALEEKSKLWMMIANGVTRSTHNACDIYMGKISVFCPLLHKFSSSSPEAIVLPADVLRHLHFTELETLVAHRMLEENDSRRPKWRPFFDGLVSVLGKSVPATRIAYY